MAMVSHWHIRSTNFSNCTGQHFFFKNSDLTFSKHVSTICTSTFYHNRDFSCTRKNLDRRTSVTFANAFVSSRLDYCNSMFHRLSAKQLRRLKAIQNTLCRINCNQCNKFLHITNPMKSLHWSPVRFIIMFKINLLTL